MDEKSSEDYRRSKVDESDALVYDSLLCRKKLELFSVMIVVIVISITTFIKITTSRTTTTIDNTTESPLPLLLT